MSDWITIEPSLDPVLEPINPIISSIDSILSLLISTLNIVQTILNVLKVFLVGVLDPLRTLVEVLIDEVRSLIMDLRQLGVYITGDWQLITSEDRFSSLVGGYSAYERRMISRLLDTSDPNRPDFTSSSAVVGAFFYVSSQDINEIVRVVNALLKFFGQSDLMGRASPYGTPTRPEMKYGTAGSGTFRGLAKATQSLIPDSVSVSWTMPAGTGGSFSPFSPSPKGFLIHVSTIPDGFQVLSLVSKAQLSSEIENIPRVAAAAVDPTTNGPLKLYGGVADIGSTADSHDWSQLEQSEDPHAPLLVLQKDQNTPLIKPSTLQGGSVPLVACTYFVKAGALNRLGVGTKFTATFQKSDLPRHASFSSGSDGFAVASEEDPTTYYFRVRALTDDYVSRLSGLSGSLTSPDNIWSDSEVRLYRFSREQTLRAVNGVLIPEDPGADGETELQPNHFTSASSPGIAEFPTAQQAQYIKAVQAAFAVAILTRADLTEANSSAEEFCYNQFASGQATGLEPAGRDLLARYSIKPVMYRAHRPGQFRLRMRWALQRIATGLQVKTAPPDSVAEAVVNSAQTLLNFRWSDIHTDYPHITILESLGIGVDQAPLETQGVGANPFCRALPKGQIEQIYAVAGGPARGPSFITKGSSDRQWVAGEGSADFSPIIYDDASSRVEFIRNALLGNTTGLQVVKGAASVLQLAAASVSRPIGDTQWIAIRLMPQALAPLDEILERLDRFLQGVMDGLEGTTDKIIAYIEAIQARIYQLQALLNQIRALLHALNFFRIPSVSGLVLVESGTEGLTSGLVSAESKPTDSASSYGGGVAVVAGGLPQVLLELLALLLSGGDN